MGIKWMGAIFVVLGCGGFGFSIASAHRKEEKMMRQMLYALQNMEWELQYRLTSLPEICIVAGKETDGILRKIFLSLSEELSGKTEPDASACLAGVLRRYKELPAKLRKIFRHLGSVLGRYDLEGQLQGIHAVQEELSLQLKDCGRERDQRLRSYHTLGLCAGMALAIILV